MSDPAADANGRLTVPPARPRPQTGLRSIRSAARDNGCEGTSIEEGVLPGITITVWAGCVAPVRLYTCDGAGHYPCGPLFKAVFKDLLDAVVNGTDASGAILA